MVVSEPDGALGSNFGLTLATVTTLVLAHPTSALTQAGTQSPSCNVPSSYILPSYILPAPSTKAMPPRQCGSHPPRCPRPPARRRPPTHSPYTPMTNAATTLPIPCYPCRILYVERLTAMQEAGGNVVVSESAPSSWVSELFEEFGDMMIDSVKFATKTSVYEAIIYEAETLEQVREVGEGNIHCLHWWSCECLHLPQLQPDSCLVWWNPEKSSPYPSFPGCRQDCHLILRRRSRRCLRFCPRHCPPRQPPPSSACGIPTLGSSQAARPLLRPFLSSLIRHISIVSGS